MTIDRTEIGGKVVLHVAGRMDADNAVQFDQQCEACIAEGITSLVVDLADLRYVSSLGLRSFVAFAQKLRQKGGELRICVRTDFSAIVQPSWFAADLGIARQQ